MIQNNWLSLSEEDREFYEFRLQLDPRVLYQVSDGKVNSDGLQAIIAYYKFESEKLSCCICNTARHYEGAVVLLKDETHRLVGNCCGRKHFGDEWFASSNAIAKAERDANYRKKARLLLEDQYDITSAAKSLRSSASKAETARKEVKALLGIEFGRISKELERNIGSLSYEIVLDRSFRDQGTQGSLTSTLQETDTVVGWQMYTEVNWITKVENNIGKMEAAFGNLRRAFDKGHALAGPIKKVKACVDELLSLYSVFDSIRSYNAAKNAEILDFWFIKKGIPLRIESQQSRWTLNARGTTRHASLPSLPVIQIPSSLKLAIERLS